MPAEVKQDILYNFIVDTANFAGAMGSIIQGWDRLDDGIKKVEKNTSFLNRVLSTFTGVVLRDLTRAALRAGRALVRLGGNFVRYIADIEVVEERIKGIGENVHQIFIPAIRALVNVVGDALTWVERLFKDPTGKWTEGFLRLRATVQVFANWLLSIWERMTVGVGDATETMMDRFVDAIIRGVRLAADALRRFATFMASVFGGRAPAEVTSAAIAATRPGARPPISLAREPAPAPKKPPKLPKAPKEVSPVDPEDLRKMSFLSNLWAKATAKLAKATQAAAKARSFLARAEERLEAAAEKVYDIRRKIERLELEWAEIPERFIRGRRKQLQLELQAAEHVEHERKKEKDAAQERFQAAEKYRRELEKVANALKRQIDTLAKSIERQAERYADYLTRMEEWAASNAERLAEWRAEGEEATTAWGKLDKLTGELDAAMGVYLEQIEGELLPAFADIELSVKSIVDTLKIGWETTKQWAADLLEKLREVRQWWDDLPDWVKNILKGLGIAVALNFVTGGAVGTIISSLIAGAFTAAGLIPGVGWAIAAGALALFITIKPFLSPEVKEAWRKAWDTLMFRGGDPVTAIGAAAEATLEAGPLAWLLKWTDEFSITEWADSIVTPIENLFRGSARDMEDATKTGITGPMENEFDRAARNIVEGSIVPDMVNAILDWMKRLANRLGEYLDQMAAKFRILEDSIRGLEPALADIRQFASGGSIKVINIKGPFNIGGDLTEADVNRAIYDAIAALPGL